MEQGHDGMEKKPNADAVGGDGDGEILNGGRKNDDSESFYSLLCLTIGPILFPDSESGDASSSSLLQRIRTSVAENGPKLREAFERSSQELLLWTRSGSPLRALLVITIGTIVLVTTMALVVFTLFFVAATANAIIISLLISLAVAGGCLALFFLCLTAIYIGALSIAAFIISAVAVSAIVCVLIASGWIGFFYAVWLGTKGSLRLAQQSVSVMGLAVSGNTFTRHHRQQDRDQDREVNISHSTENPSL